MLTNPAEVHYSRSDRETILRLWEVLSTVQFNDAKDILNDAIAGLVDINVFGAVDLVIDLQNALANDQQKGGAQ
ncbi:MAG TPA: hypothetical protein VGD78_20100 [Chthoniobacterales bacterium]